MGCIAQKKSPTKPQVYYAKYEFQAVKKENSMPPNEEQKLVNLNIDKDKIEQSDNQKDILVEVILWITLGSFFKEKCKQF